MLAVGARTDDCGRRDAPRHREGIRQPLVRDRVAYREGEPNPKVEGDAYTVCEAERRDDVALAVRVAEREATVRVLAAAHRGGSSAAPERDGLKRRGGPEVPEERSQGVVAGGEGKVNPKP